VNETSEASEQQEQTENISQESTDAGNEPSSQQASVIEQQEDQEPAAASIVAITQEVADSATEENAATISSPSFEALEQGLRNRLPEKRKFCRLGYQAGDLPARKRLCLL
jgi:hypothetical protein